MPPRNQFRHPRSAQYARKCFGENALRERALREKKNPRFKGHVPFGILSLSLQPHTYLHDRPGTPVKMRREEENR